MSDLKYSIINYIEDPKNPLSNFMLGTYYEGLGQTAAASSYYVRTAEFGDDPVLTYEALIRIGLCLSKQGSRTFLAKGVFLRAISLLPDRPEAYFLLARLYERTKDWQEAYTWSVLGETLFPTEPEVKILHSDTEYPGIYGFTFEKAVSSWWIGLKEESIHIFKQLYKHKALTQEHRNLVVSNLKRLWNTWKNPIRYDISMHPKLRFKFDGSEKLEQNYSQCYQDMFVLSMLNGKKNGFFLEIGHGDPFFGNNTFLLEKELGWKGISVDFNPELGKKFRENRKSTVLTENAVTLDYKTLLDGKVVDYLQIDCDPPIVSLNVLKRIPFHTHKFAVITFEHDYYNGDNSLVREDSRKYLKTFGYELIAGNIAADDYYAFEDWYVHPDLVDKDIIEKMKSLSDDTKRADLYMLSKI